MPRQRATLSRLSYHEPVKLHTGPPVSAPSTTRVATRFSSLGEAVDQRFEQLEIGGAEAGLDRAFQRARQERRQAGVRRR